MSLKCEISRRNVLLSALRIRHASMETTNVSVLTMGLVERRMRVMLLRRITGLIRLSTNVRVTNEIIQIASRSNANTLVSRFLGLLRLERKRAFLSNDNSNASLNAHQSNRHRVIDMY